MTIQPPRRELQALLDRLGPADRISFDRFEHALLTTKYTGFVGLHILGGKIQQVDLGAPIRLSIVETAPASAAPPRLVLDKRPKDGAG